MTTRRLAALTAAALVLTGTSVAAASAERPETEDGRATDVPHLGRSPDLLEAPRRGERAIRQLGAQLPTAAARNDMSASALRRLLREDRTARVDTGGYVHFVEPVAGAAAPSPTTASAVPVAPLDETFQLHSNPGAELTILLDFDGEYVADTWWNTSYAVTAATHPAWDPAGDGATFSDSERRRVQAVWALVAEDYAPFDVDVTTEDPGSAGMVRSSSGDPTYGTRVLITPSSDPYAKICPSGCGGVAYLSVFDRVGSAAQPAWVFPQGTGNDPKGVAEAASHEAGHNLGLEHHGTSSQGYYAGHGSWAPIMGVGYYKPLAQWSHGSYPGANNATQDDTTILAGYLGTRLDDAPSLPAAAVPLPSGQALIGSAADTDAWALGACRSGSAVEVAAAALAPNLDVRAVLHDPLGQVVATSEPPSGSGDGITASGVGGSLTIPTTGDGYVLTVEGVGEGTWSTNGYDDYGSLGAYTVSATGCTIVADGAPTAPLDLASASAGANSLTLTWTEPAVAGSSPVTDYVVSRSGSTDSWVLPATARSHTFTGLTAATSYDLSVRARNGAGTGPAATVTARTVAPPPAPPGAPRELTGSYDTLAGVIDIQWAEPASPGTQPISGYAVYLDGTRLGMVGATQRGASIDHPSGFAERTYLVEVAAISSVGESSRAATQVTVDRPETAPAPPVQVAARPGDSSATVSWQPGVDGGSPITRYTITASPGGVVTTVAGGDVLASTVTGLDNGVRYRFAVTATNSVGSSETSGWSEPVIPSGPPLRMRAPGVEVTGSKAIVTWRAAKANGAPIRRYKVDVTTGKDKSVSAGTRKTVLKRLERGRYTVRIRARNANGWGTYSPKVRFQVR